MEFRLSNEQRKFEQMFDWFNGLLFNGEIEKPVITIQSGARARAYGWFSVSKIWADDRHVNERRHELNISSEWMHRSIKDVAITMVHEMVHCYCAQHGIQDTSRGYEYHNSNFRKEAEKVGLICEKHERIGCITVDANDTLKDYIFAFSARIDMHTGAPIFVGGGSGTNGTNGTNGKPPVPTRTGKPKGSNSRKYVCPCCKAIIRATRDVNVICGDCGERFEKVDG